MMWLISWLHAMPKLLGNVYLCVWIMLEKWIYYSISQYGKQDICTYCCFQSKKATEWQNKPSYITLVWLVHSFHLFLCCLIRWRCYAMKLIVFTVVIAGFIFITLLGSILGFGVNKSWISWNGVSHDCIPVTTAERCVCVGRGEAEQTYTHPPPPSSFTSGCSSCLSHVKSYTSAVQFLLVSAACLTALPCHSIVYSSPIIHAPWLWIASAARPLFAENVFHSCVKC